MSWISLAFAALAVALAVRWWATRVDALGRAKPFPFIGVALLGFIAVAAFMPGYLRHREERSLSAVAARLVGAPVTVRCQSFGQELVDLGSELGYVRYDAAGVPGHHTLIKHGPCKALNDYRRSGKQHPTDDEVVAVHVLTHESMHMRGLTVEAAAECAAVQRDELTAKLLGADDAEARALARRYWLLDYPRMPDDYRSGDCAPGATMDEHLATAPWTTAPS
jgi:hypothetical protein